MNLFITSNSLTKKSLIAICVASSLFQGSLALADSSTTAKEPRPLLIDTTYLNPALILPPAPESATTKGKKELLDVKTVVAKVTPEEKALAAKDALTKNVSFFADTVPGFDLKALPLTKALFDQVRYSEDTEAKVFKNHFMRNRPYITDASIKTCVDPEKGGEKASYPSGHATMGYSMGIVLANLIPEKAPQILERANLYAENQLLCGVHHRSDIVAGQVLGTIVAVELIQNYEFRKQMEAARQELKAAGLTQ